MSADTKGSFFSVRPLRPGELDHEVIWFSVSVSTAVLVGIWLHLRLPWPDCKFHQITGWPCVGCGTTRCFKSILAGHWATALAFNPLAFLAAWAIAIYDMYALAVITTKLPRIRLNPLPANVAQRIRLGVFVIAALNWAWLIYCHR